MYINTRNGEDKLPKQSIIIDPGHGGSDLGAVHGNYLEKDWALDISLHMAEELRAYGHPVALTRVTDTALIPSQRAKLVRYSNAAVCISNHINGGSGEGAEVIYSLHNEKYLAALILEELIITGMKRRRIYTRESTSYQGEDYYYMHRDTKPIETVIVEYGFIDNANDRAKLIKPEFRKELAKAAVRGITEYLALATLSKKLEQNAPPPPAVAIIDANGLQKAFPKEKAKIIQGYTYLEGRELTNLLGGKVQWDATTKTAVFDFKK